MLLSLSCGQRTLEWPWSQARVKYTGSMGLNSDKNLNLSTLVMHGTEVYSENEWSWDNTNQLPQLLGRTGKEIKIGCGVISGSTHEKATQISLTKIKSNEKERKICASENLDCWYNFTLEQPVLIVCLWAHHNVGLSFKFKIDIIELSTTISTPTTIIFTNIDSSVTMKNKKTLFPQIFETGPYVTRNTGQQ